MAQFVRVILPNLSLVSTSDTELQFHLIFQDYRNSFSSIRIGEMNFFNQERKLFGERLEPNAPNLSAPVAASEEQPPEDNESHAADNAKRGTLIFTNRACLFSQEELNAFFNRISAQIRGEKKRGRIPTADEIRGRYEQGRCVMGAADCQVWGYTCIVPITEDIDVLETTIRRDFQNTQPAKQLVDLLSQGLLHSEKTAYALSWTSYTERLYGKLGWLPCNIKMLDSGTKEALKTYDEVVEQYNIFIP